jgi:alpha-glucosidase
VFKTHEAFTVAEAYGVKPEQLKEYAGEGGFFSAIFDFTYTDLENGVWYKTWQPSAAELRELIFKSQQGLLGKACGAPYFENHDQNRSPNRYLDPAQRTFEGTAMLGIIFFFLQGVPFIYQGQELGMTNYPWKNMEEFDDVSTIDQYQRALQEGFSKEEAFGFVRHRSRDNARTPMLWDNSPQGGFSSGRPWLPVHPDYPGVNAAVQRAAARGAEQNQTDSIFGFYKKLIALRKEHPQLFFAGDFTPCLEDNPSLIAYGRTLQNEEALIVCNFSKEKQLVDLAKVGIQSGGLQVWLGNRRAAGSTLTEGKLVLEPLEGLVLGR